MSVAPDSGPDPIKAWIFPILFSWCETPTAITTCTIAGLPIIKAHWSTKDLSGKLGVCQAGPANVVHNSCKLDNHFDENADGNIAAV